MCQWRSGLGMGEAHARPMPLSSPRNGHEGVVPLSWRGVGMRQLCAVVVLAENDELLLVFTDICCI